MFLRISIVAARDLTKTGSARGYARGRCRKIGSEEHRAEAWCQGQIANDARISADFLTEQRAVGRVLHVKAGPVGGDEVATWRSKDEELHRPEAISDVDISAFDKPPGVERVSSFGFGDLAGLDFRGLLIDRPGNAHILIGGELAEIVHVVVRDECLKCGGSPAGVRGRGDGLAVGEQLLERDRADAFHRRKNLLHAVVWLRRVFFVEVALRESGTVCWRRVSCDMDVRNVMTVT